MSAVSLRLRAEFRERLGSWLGIALLVGLASGVSMAAAAGARRTDTAYPRLALASRAFDVLTGGASGSEGEFVAGLHELATLPQVADSEITTSFLVPIRTRRGRILRFPQLAIDIAPANGSEPAPKILAGRNLLSTRPDEATVSFAARAPDVTLGSPIELLFNEGPRQSAVSIRIVGVHAGIGEFPSVNGVSFPGLRLSEAFLAGHRSLIDPILPSNKLSEGFHLKRGAADVEGFRNEAERRGIKVELPVSTSDHIKGVQKTLRFESSALWLLALFTGVASLLILSQSLARQAYLEAGDYSILRSLGMSQRQLIGVGITRALAVGAAGAAVGVGLGIIGSTLTPIGLARIAEPTPGIVVDTRVLFIGGVSAFLLVLAVSVWPAWGAARAAASAGADGLKRSAAVNAIVRTPAPITAVTGVRFALTTGRRGSAVPTRSAVLGTIFGVGAIVMALTFVASLHHVINTPALTGFRWDALVSGDDPDAILATLRRNPAVAAVDKGGSISMKIGSQRMLALITPANSDVGPVVLEGHAPLRADEIALGTKTMRDQHLHFGSTVEASLSTAGASGGGTGSLLMRVVGRVVVPSVFFEAHAPGEGAALTVDGLARIDKEAAQRIPVLVRFRSPADVDVNSEKLQPLGFVARRQTPGDIAALSGVSALPLALAGPLAAIAIAALIHALVSTIRRRRRDLAILKTLGFVRRQVVATVAWQAATLLVLGLVVSVPVGVVLGRWGWQLFANQIAIVPSPVVPRAQVAALVPGGILLAVIVAFLPGRIAARTRPALILRTE